MISVIKAQFKAGVFSSLGRSHKIMMLFVFVMGCLVTLTMGSMYQRSLEANAHQYVLERTASYADELGHHINSNLKVIDAFWALFEGSENVSRQEFTDVASQLFVAAPYLEFAMWLPDQSLRVDAPKNMKVGDVLNYPPKHGQIWPVIDFLKQRVGDSSEVIQPRFSDQRLGLPFIKQGAWLESPLRSMTFESDVAMVALPMPRKVMEGNNGHTPGWLVVGLAVEPLIRQGVDDDEFKSLFFSPDAALEVVQYVGDVQTKIYRSTSSLSGLPYATERVRLGPDIHWQMSFYPSTGWLQQRVGIGFYVFLLLGFVLSALLCLGLALRFGVLERRSRGLLEQVYALEEQLVALGKESARDVETGLLLREDLDGQLDMECRRAVREFLPLSFLIVSVDRSQDWHELPEAMVSFKRVVQCLVASISRPGDVGFRFDTLSAAFVLPATNEQVATLAEKCREKVEQLVLVNPQTQQVLTVSVGVVTLQPTDDLCAKKVIDAAVTALTQAQAQAGNCVVAEVEESDELPVTFLV